MNGRKGVLWGAATAALVTGWRRARRSDVTSLRKLANREGITTWSAWRKGRVG
ncbi:MAG: hypothetical protein AB1679_08240 [Actinomycetota bacterium]|jgi:hypothetical protein